MAVNVEKRKSMTPLGGMDFHISKLGHIALQVSDLEEAIAQPAPGQDTHLPR